MKRLVLGLLACAAYVAGSAVSANARVCIRLIDRSVDRVVCMKEYLGWGVAEASEVGESSPSGYTPVASTVSMGW